MNRLERRLLGKQALLQTLTQELSTSTTHLQSVSHLFSIAERTIFDLPLASCESAAITRYRDSRRLRNLHLNYTMTEAQRRELRYRLRRHRWLLYEVPRIEAEVQSLQQRCSQRCPHIFARLQVRWGRWGPHFLRRTCWCRSRANGTGNTLGLTASTTVGAEGPAIATAEGSKVSMRTASHDGQASATVTGGTSSSADAVVNVFGYGILFALLFLMVLSWIAFCVR